MAAEDSRAFNPNKLYSWPQVRDFVRNEAKKKIEDFMAAKATFTSSDLLTEKSKAYIERLNPSELEKNPKLDPAHDIGILLGSMLKQHIYKGKLWRAVHENTYVTWKKGISTLIFTTLEPRVGHFPPPRDYVFIPNSTKKPDVPKVVAELLRAPERQVAVHHDESVRPESELQVEDVRPPKKESRVVYSLDKALEPDWKKAAVAQAELIQAMAGAHSETLSHLADLATAVKQASEAEIIDRPAVEEEAPSLPAKPLPLFDLVFDGSLAAGQCRIDGETGSILFNPSSGLAALRQVMKDKGLKLTFAPK